MRGLLIGLLVCSILVVLFLVMILVVGSPETEPREGPQGPKGEKGPEGERGEDALAQSRLVLELKEPYLVKMVTNDVEPLAVDWTTVLNTDPEVFRVVGGNGFEFSQKGTYKLTLSGSMTTGKAIGNPPKLLGLILFKSLELKDGRKQYFSIPGNEPYDEPDSDNLSSFSGVGTVISEAKSVTQVPRVHTVSQTWTFSKNTSVKETVFPAVYAANMIVSGVYINAFGISVDMC